MRFTKVLLAILIGISTVFIVAPAQAATCYTTSDYGERWFDNDLATVHIYYQYCKEYNPNGTLARRWVKADFSVNSYNANGTNMSCNPVGRRLDGFRFNWRFYRYDGVAYNPGPIEVPCDPSTINSDIQQYEFGNQPRLYWSSDFFTVAPRWSVVITQMNNVWPDESKTIDTIFAP